jgi:hypothetical protein
VVKTFVDSVSFLSISSTAKSGQTKRRNFEEETVKKKSSPSLEDNTQYLQNGGRCPSEICADGMSNVFLR